MPFRVHAFIFNLAVCLIPTFVGGCNKQGIAADPPLTTPVFGQLQFLGTGFQHNGIYPKLYTCDSLGQSPGLNWSKVPSGVKGFAVTMHHYPPTGDKHVYWVVYSIPPDITSIPDGQTGVYSYGINTVNGKNIYTPPCSQGPGPKVYILTLYALSRQPTITAPPAQVTMDVLLDAIRTVKLDSAVMSVTYTR